MSTLDTFRRRPQLSVRKRAAFTLATTIVACVVAASCGEITMRLRRVALTARLRAALGNAGEQTGWAVFDEDLHYRNRPHWRDHNAHGMRDDPVRETKDRFRILLLGDSLGYEGDRIDDTYPGRLETLLNQNTILPPSEVLNSSTKGYTNYQELVYLKKYGLAHKPDLVLLAFCVNDLHKYLHDFDVVNGEIVANTYGFTAEAAGSSSPAFLGRSLFLTWIWRKGAAASTRIGLRSGTIFECRPDISNCWKDAAWPAMDAQLEELAEVCEQNGISLAVIAFPHAEQYRDRYLESDRGYVLKPQEKLAAICRRLNLAFVDLYDRLHAGLFLPDGIHLNRTGRETVAAALAEFLGSSGLVPAQSSKKGGDSATGRLASPIAVS